MYLQNDLVKIARRENNNKRGYLVVNAQQGKHVPVAPSEAMGLFLALAKLVGEGITGERVLVIGFAETATAIGAAVATHLGCNFMQTTRETKIGAQYLYFSEAHSHATEQKLERDSLAKILPQIDRIILVEDELTTGNTILNLVNVFEQEFEFKLKFTAACLLCGMNKGNVDNFNANGIDLKALHFIDHLGFNDKALASLNDGMYHKALQSGETSVDYTNYSGWLDTRSVVNGGEYITACRDFWRKIKEDFDIKSGESILVLGTEEFMFLGLYVANKMQDCGARVKFHATTRSPIEVSNDAEYPLHVRYELRSLYEANRITYIYDLGFYDRVFVLTDAEDIQNEGVCTLISALKDAGNEKIDVIKWCKN